MLTLGFYLHNLSLPIVKNAKNPSKNVRDVFLGYFMVYFCYVSVGVFGYIGFRGKYFHQNEIEQVPIVIS